MTTISPRSTTRTLLVLALVVFGAGRARAADIRALCKPDGLVKVAVNLKPPPGQGLAGVKVRLDYPENSVKIPGFENQPTVQARVSGTPAGFLVAPNDSDTELVVALVGTTALPPGSVFTVEFDRCKDRAPVGAADFHCKVEEASTPQAKLVEGATCAVDVIKDKTSDSRIENQLPH